MRIALIVYGDLSVRSGGNLYDETLVSTLCGRGHSLEVISIPAPSTLGPLGALSHNLPLSVQRHITHRIAGRGFDIVLQDELVHASLFGWNHRLRVAAEAPLVGIVHHMKLSEWTGTWRRRLWGLVEKRYLRSLDGYIFNSETTKQAVEAEVGATTKPAIVATPGGDRLSGLSMNGGHEGKADDELRLLFVGNLIARKGLHDLLAAVEPLKAVSLEIVGSDSAETSYAADLRRRYASAALDDRVRFLGEADDSRLAQAFSMADALVVPSRYEGFGIVYLEAMSFGLPIVASRAGAVPGIVGDEVSGLLVEPNDVQALTAAIQRLLNENGLRQRLIQGARERYARFPTWSQSMNRIADFLETHFG